MRRKEQKAFVRGLARMIIGGNFDLVFMRNAAAAGTQPASRADSIRASGWRDRGGHRRRLDPTRPPPRIRAWMVQGTVMMATMANRLYDGYLP